MAKRGRLGAALALSLLVPVLGCPREPSASTTTSEPTPEPAPDPIVAPDPGAPSGVCGNPGERFVDYDWVPDDSRLTTSILRRDPELGAALKTLAVELERDTVQLPIRATLDYKNLRMQLFGLEGVINTVEVDPGELVELHSPDGDVVWLWPTTCPTATFATRMLDRFAVLVRVDFERPGVRLGAASAEFPFDLVLMHERLVALAPRGRGAHVGAWLSAPRLDPDGPGVALASIELAPIRSVLSGPSLLAGVERSSPPQTSRTRHLELRVTASAWTVGASEAEL